VLARAIPLLALLVRPMSALSRPLASWHRRRFHNDTFAVQEAINQVKAGGGSVFVQPQRCLRNRRLEIWVYKVQRFANIRYPSLRLWCSRCLHLLSSPQRRLTVAFRSPLRRDTIIKSGAHVLFRDTQIVGNIHAEWGANVSFTGCYITGTGGPVVTAGPPGGIGPGIIFGSTGFVSNPPVAALPDPAEPLEIVRRTTPIIGFRGWRVVVDPDRGLLLGSARLNSQWNGVQTTHAECLAENTTKPDVAHAAPVAACGCGLYLMKRLADLEQYTDPDMVVGAVVSWGRIIEHTDGFRAEYARPLALVAGMRAAEQLGGALGLPVVAADWLENYAKEFGDLVG